MAGVCANYGGGGGRRCKHWPPGAGDPRYATGLTNRLMTITTPKVCQDRSLLGNMQVHSSAWDS